MLYGSRKIIALSLSLSLSSHTVHAIEPIMVGMSIAAVGILYAADAQGATADNTPKAPEGTVISGMAGVYDGKISKITSEWQNDGQIKRDENRAYGNRMILHGPSGNGKTMMAKKLAEQTGSKHMEYKGSEFIDKYIGSGAASLRKVFEEAIAHYEKTGERVIISIDEIDAIAGLGSNKENNSPEYQNTQMELWNLLDKYENDNRIFFIGTTNSLNVLDQRIKRRFRLESVEIPAPNDNQREAVAKYYFSKLNNVDLEAICSGQCKKDFIKNTKGFSNSDLKSVSRLIKDETNSKSEQITPALIGNAIKSIATDVENEKKEEAEKKELQKPHGLSVWEHVKAGMAHGVVTAVVAAAFGKLGGNNGGNNAGGNK